MVWAVLALLLGAFQDTGAEQLIAQLSDDQPEIREQAYRNLRTMGLKAYDTLLRVPDSKDADLRTRVNLLILECEHDKAQAELDAAQAALEVAQRPEKLRLVTLDVKDQPYEAFLDSLALATRTKVYDYRPQANRRVTLKADRKPLTQVINQLGSQVRVFPGCVIFGDLVPPPNPVYFEGGRLSFASRPWKVNGQVQGTVFETGAVSDLNGDLEWDIAEIKTDRKLKVDHCLEHSPGLVYVEGAGIRDPVVTVRVLRRWYTSTAIHIHVARDVRPFRCGPYEISLQWPAVVIKSDQAIEDGVFEKMLSASDIRVTLKDSTECPAPESTPRTPHENRPEERLDKALERVWCGCPRRPVPGEALPPGESQMREVQIGQAKQYLLKDVRTVEILFHKPIEEKFEVSSPPLK